MKRTLLIHAAVALCVGYVSFDALAEEAKQITPEEKATSMIGAPKGDEELVRNIRKAITDDDSLSMAAKNITITARNGKVNLTGKVRSQEEKEKILQKAREATEKKNIYAKLDIEK